MIGSGTLSGDQREKRGCLMEITWGGRDPIILPDGETRVYLEDGDSLTLKGKCKGDGYTIGFGECSGTILPSLTDDHFF